MSPKHHKSPVSQEISQSFGTNMKSWVFYLPLLTSPTPSVAPVEQMSPASWWIPRLLTHRNTIWDHASAVDVCVRCLCDSYVWLHLNTVVQCVCACALRVRADILGAPVSVSFGWCVWVVACLHTPTWTGNSHMSFGYSRWDPSERKHTQY